MARAKKVNPMHPVTVTLRREDLEYLQRLSVEQFSKVTPEEFYERLRKGERPGASMAVRYLIDQSRRGK